MAVCKESVGAPGDRPQDFEEISFDYARKELVGSGYWHAAHAMFFARDPDHYLWQTKLNLKGHARIMMQSRFDGNIGFPGGLLDKGPEESPVDALNRELVEEINLDRSTLSCCQDDLLVTHVNHQKKLVTYFYVKELTLAEFNQAERNVMDAEEWGTETFGVLRVPLFTMKDGYRGLPVFLANRFAGNARMQLLQALRAKNIIPAAMIDTAMEKYLELRKQDDTSIFQCDD